MARTYPELVEEWESKIEGHQSAQAITLLQPPFCKGEMLASLRLWREAADLAEDILGELKAWKEQACGYEASRDLMRERLDFAQREGFEALQRLSWVEANARRLIRFVEGQATCSGCGRYDHCEDGCEGPFTIEQAAEMKKAREALDGFAL